MKQSSLLAAITVLAVVAAHARPGTSPDDSKGAAPHPVTVTRREWKDAKRDREAPVTIYAPKDGAGPFPVIVFSHGLGGSRDGYEYLGRHWASRGYVCVHLQHRGSDDSVWKGSEHPLADLRKAVRDPANIVNRPLDVRFALDQLARLNRDDPAFRGRLDLEHVGMAGHSFGGWTTQAVIGEVFVTPGGRKLSGGDERIKAAVIMSPSPPSGKADLDQAFGEVRVPCLHLTGTEDTGMTVSEVKPADRRLPFDHIHKADQYLVIFKGGDHMIFPGTRGRLGNGSRDARFHDLILRCTTAFWDAYLKGDAGARAWLQGEGFRKALGEDGTFEKHGPAPK